MSNGGREHRPPPPGRCTGGLPDESETGALVVEDVGRSSEQYGGGGHVLQRLHVRRAGVSHIGLRRSLDHIDRDLKAIEHLVRDLCVRHRLVRRGASSLGPVRSGSQGKRFSENMLG